MKILYLGDAARAALYLTDVFAYLDHQVTHVPMSSKVPELEAQYDVIILSDYPAKKIDDTTATFIRQNTEQGGRLIMLGGWDSFNGQGEGYASHPLAELLPVLMQQEDDRVNAHQGLIISADSALQSNQPIDWSVPPVICGYNAVVSKENSQTVAWMRPIQSDGVAISLLEPLPFMVKTSVGNGSVLACMTDLAPHWCGGLIDWGSSRVELENVEVGSMYPLFVQLLLEV